MSQLTQTSLAHTSTQLLSYHVLSVLDALSQLQNALQALKHPLLHLDAKLPLWFSPPATMGFPTEMLDREKVFLYLSQLEYLDEQDPKEILIGPGIVAASQSTLEAVHGLNVCKQVFKERMLALRAIKLTKAEKQPFNDAIDQLLIHRRHDATGQTLRKIGLARLHLKQCYRLVPTFLKKPEKIAWTWANTRSIVRISVAEAEARLIKQGLTDRTAWQQQKLQQIPKNESLAIVQDLAPHLRANLTFKDSRDHAFRKMVKGPVPFFYLTDNPQPETEVLPKLRHPGDKKGKNKDRPTRKDVKLEPLAFLPAIRAHRYVC